MKSVCFKNIYDQENDAEFFAFKDEKTELSKIQNVNGRVQDGDKNLNKFGKIDGARLQNFDPETRTLTIRVDDTNVPGFWMEIPLKLDQVEKWLKIMKSEEEIKSKPEDFMNSTWF